MGTQVLAGDALHTCHRHASSRSSRRHHSCSSRPAAAAAAAAGPRRHSAFPPQQQQQQLTLGRGSSCARPSVAATAAAAEQSAASTSGARKLAEIELLPIIDTQGYILQEGAPGSEGAAACVYAVFDEKKRLQYVGFGRDLKASLCTLFTRRPDKAYYYKAHFLQAMDQEAMLAVRSAWFDECGGPPPGNKLALERKLWQQPAEAFTISERGKRAAAEEDVKVMLEAIRLRSCREEFEADPQLLDDGKIDFLPAKEYTAEERAEKKAAFDAARARQRTVSTVIAGQPASFELLFKGALTTKGGHMFDVQVTHASRESDHRIIIGTDYFEPYGLEPRDAAQAIVEFMLQREMPRQTEGMLLSTQFPVNYFSASGLDQFDDEFVPFLAARGGKGAEEEGGGFWRFNKVHSYGGTDFDDLDGWSMALDRRRDDDSDDE